ncbi:unnamed protein product [Medioppia subpectinata]|uniref:Uncharacterized protein n=1 Tax=Medioppia subpectinata TaxID=1979941 RepID=A0A7R9KSE7_9ACAR|nr:unnamed protein product [Medioppia subpectinata]CAG2108919.1 unnamed protein product [Medioppia subpectinata]
MLFNGQTIGVDTDQTSGFLVASLKRSCKTLTDGFLRRPAAEKFSAAGLRKNPSLIPLFFFAGLGGVWAGYYLLRLATRNPDVCWNKKGNPEPWQEYDKKQYKFWSQIDHVNYEHPRPRF